MWITLHALALLACPIVAIAAVFFAPRKPGQKPAGVWALVWPVLVAVVPATSRHLCDEGQAILQWLIPLFCLWLVAVFVGHVTARRSVAWLLAVAMWILTFHYEQVVHERDITGNPNWGRGSRAVSNSTLRVIKVELADCSALDTTEYPAGWVRDLSFASLLEFPLYRGPIRGEVASFWHSSWTSLYRPIRIPQDYWYPGGTLAAAADRIEIRDRPDATWGLEP